MNSFPPERADTGRTADASAPPGKELIMPPRSLPTRTLREHPALDQLKQQAKELLEAFRAGESDAVAEVHATIAAPIRRPSRSTTRNS